MNKATRRSANFTNVEVELLLKLAIKYFKIIENKKSDSHIWKEKKELWRRITVEFNSQSANKRDGPILKKKWDNIKKNIKNKVAGDQQCASGTGGGPALPPDNERRETMSQSEKDILSLMKVQAVGLPSSYDCDEMEDLPTVILQRLRQPAVMVQAVRPVPDTVDLVEGIIADTVDSDNSRDYKPDQQKSSLSSVLQNTASPVTTKKSVKRPLTGTVTNKIRCQPSGKKKKLVNLNEEKLRRDIEIQKLQKFNLQLQNQELQLKIKLLKLEVESKTWQEFFFQPTISTRLVCGAVRGNFNSLFSRLESISKKSGPFDVLLCVGDFFGDDNAQLDAYKMGTKKVSVPTYVFSPSIKDSKFSCAEGAEIVPNVVYMGKRGLFTTSADVKIAYLSGVSRRELGAEGPDGAFEPSDCSAVRDACLRGHSEYRGVDILVTDMWPRGIESDEKQKMDIDQKSLSDLMSWLCMHIKPRYHFAPSPSTYYERQPYRNLSVHQEYRECATRFIALAPVANKSREKWLYACSLQPVAHMRMTELLQATTDETDCPYDPELLRQHQPGKVVKCTGNGQFFYDMNPPDDQGKRKRDGDNRERKKRVDDPDSCWFCLSSPNVEKHLVVSVGSHCYLALAKGPLTPFHVLILPITHHQALTQVSDEIIEEIKKFKDALRKMFTSMDSVVVFFERNFKTSHLQIQCVPLPKLCQEQILELFQDEAGINSIQLDLLPPHSDVTQIVAAGTPYFHAELPSGDQLFARTRHNFPLQFGRDVLSSPPLLDCEDKADWRQCLLGRQEEAECVINFRERFKPFDFTAEDDDSD